MAARVALLAVVVAVCAGTVTAVYGPEPAEWASKSVLHILTDRFALPDCPATPRPCKDLDNACGGTHVGLRQRLDYIQGMGFDAVWISPVTSQTGGPVRELQDGWHGYWPKNIWDLNSGLGTPKDFRDLVNAMHSRNMWVLLDIVPNHSGYFAPEDIGEMTFNQSEHYHGCEGCEPDTCNNPDESPHALEYCRIKGLPDLNQDNPYVAETLHSWLDWIRDEYHIDGFRVDAAKHMPAGFMQDMKARSHVLTIGEMLDMDWENGTRRIANMVHTNQLHTQLNYGLYGATGRVFLGPDGIFPYRPANTTLLKAAVDVVMESLDPAQVHLLGNFMDNHDMPRIASHDGMDEIMTLNALAFTFFMPGIPIIYYGTEAVKDVQREPLWEKWDYDRTAPFYVALKMMNWYRHTLQLWTRNFETVFVDGLVYAFTRGDAALVVLSSQAARNHTDELPRVVALTQLPEGMRGKMLRNIFNPNVTLKVNANGSADLRLVDLRPLVFVQQAVSPTTFLPAAGYKLLMPLDKLIFMLTLFVMAMTCLAIWWGIMRPPQCVLKCCTCFIAHLSQKPGTGAVTPVDECIVTPRRDGKDGGSAELPHMDAKLVTRTASGLGPIGKVDSSNDLQPTGSLRCMAALDSDDDESPDFIAAVRGKSPRSPPPSSGPTGSSAASAASITPLSEGSIMHVAMEYTIPELGLDGFVFGGLGKVVDTFARDWPGDMVLCAPLYAAAYADPAATAPKFCPGPPAMRFDVQVGRQAHQVEVFELIIADALPGRARRYLLLQAGVFRNRSRSDIYSFASEHDMITWLSVVNQAVATVCLNWGVRRLQLHDYHGALSLQYLPKQLRPRVLYIAHNAHYNGVFALPTKQRRAYLYSMFNLNPAAVGKYTEHKSAFDTLHSLLSHMVEAQKGVGCAAVSPKYASEIRTRLSPFWQIPQDEVVGILNAMDPVGTWAGEGISVEEACARKAAAKLQIQQRMGLAVGEQYQLAIFLGRLTHQKGVDIIAQAAPQVLARHPNLQLLVLGPLGDVAGAEAQESLGMLALDYPGRLVAPANHYVSGDEKLLVLGAADYCLCPSRYEPCGLVDIEFGWYGGLIIGNETGGLGKMPGFYFQAAAATVPHLAAKLASAFNAALAIRPERRRVLIGQALSKRFVVNDQMTAYAAMWRRIEEASRSAAAGKQHAGALASTEDAYFAQTWQRRNLNLQAAAVAAATAAPAVPSATCAVSVAPPNKPSDDGTGTPSAAGRNPSSSGGGRGLLAGLTGKGGGAAAGGAAHHHHKTKRYAGDEETTPKHAFSNYLVVLLQSMSLMPSLLLLGYMLLQQISRQTWSSCPLRPHDGEWLPGLNSLGMRVMWQLILSTAAAPMWTSVAFKKTPKGYILTVCFTTLMCLMIVLVGLIWQQSMNAALLLVSPFALTGAPLVSLGFMGCNQELSEVGYHLMLISDAFKSCLLAAVAAITTYAAGPLPFLGAAAGAAVVMTAATTWLSLPDSLAPGYTHLKLNMKWSEQRVVMFNGPKSPHLSLACSVLDMAGISVLGYLLCALGGTAFMVAVNGVAFASGVLGVGAAVALLQSRGMQLHLHSATLLLAALPGAALFKGLAAWALQPLSHVLAVVAAVQIVMGARSPLNGLLAMMTLPSREAVALWQVAGTMLSNVALLITIVVAGALALPLEKLFTPLLVALGLIEGLRLLCGIGLSKMHPKENLCAL